MRNPAVEATAGDDDPDALDETRRTVPEAVGDPHRSALRPRPASADADTQTPVGSAEWSSYDLKRALRLLHSTDTNVVKRTLRRLHIRFWHAAASKLVEILRLAGAPRSALQLVKDIVDTCRICRLWQRPPPKSMTTVRMAKDFNHIVQWDILFHRKIMISHLLDEAIRLTVASILPDRHAKSIIEAIRVHWVGRFSGMKTLVADGESGLASEEVAQYLDRCVPPIELKTKAPGEHAQMVERHHELFRRILLRIEAQLAEEGLSVPMTAIVAEGALAKNSLITVAGHTPYRGLYGREAPGLAEFEPTSETQLDDASGGVAGHSRHHHRLREMAIAAMVQETAQMRLERALNSKTRVAGEQLELAQGDLVDFWRKPATKDESGWRGPARVLEPLGWSSDSTQSAATIKWQGRSLSVRSQDL